MKSSVIILIWITFIYITTITIINADHEKFVVIYGETQTGKSSMVNAIFDKKVAPVGDDEGYSVTELADVYSMKFNKNTYIPQDFTLYIMDTPGNLDNTGKYTDDDIINHIVFAISQTTVKQIDILFVSESLSGDAMQITRNLPKIQEIFGKDVIKSIVVLGTKSGSDKRINSVKHACEQQGIRKFMIYNSMKPQKYNKQFEEFMNILFDSNIQPFEMEKVAEVRQKIEENAQKSMKEAPKEHKLIQVPHEVVKYKTIKKEEKYWDRKWGEVGRGSRRWGGIAGPRKRIDGWIPVERTRTVEEQKPYTVTEMRDKQVEIPKKIETFREKARKQWKDSLKIKVNFKSEL